MGNYSPRLVSKLNEIAHQYKDLVSRSLHAVLQQYSNTGAGLASLTVDVVDGNENRPPQIKINFDDHLIFLNQKKPQWTKLPEVDKLITWAKTKGNDDKQARKLAWAIAWDKKKHDTWKRRPWRKKSLSTVLKEMNELITKEFKQAIVDDAVSAATT